MSWDRLSRAKCKGGLGFRGFNAFNKALLGKHCWRLIDGGNSLLDSIFKSWCYPKGTFLTTSMGFQPKHAWRSIMSVRDMVLESGQWIVGKGDKLRVWKNRWLPQQASFISSKLGLELSNNALVVDLVVTNSPQWDKNFFQKLQQFRSTTNCKYSPLV